MSQAFIQPVVMHTFAGQTSRIQRNDHIRSFRGEWWAFVRVSRLAEPGRSAKVVVTRPNLRDEYEFYLNVFPELELILEPEGQVL